MIKELPDLPPIAKIDAGLCQKRFFRFVEIFWDIIIPEDPVWNWHIEFLCDELQEIVERVARREENPHDTIINIPPGTTKSTLITVMLPVWAWIRDPRIRALTASYSSALSTEHALLSRDILKSDRFKRYFPDIQIKTDQDNKTNYRNTKGGQRFSTSVGGSATGQHAHLLIVDDPINPKEATSEVIMTTANNFMDRTLSTRKTDKKVTATILVMQRLHTQDPTGHWLAKEGKKIKHICLPGRESKNIKPYRLKENYVDGLLDPVRMDEGVMEQLQTDLGSYGFAGQIMQTPSPDGGGIWKKWFVAIPDEDFPTDLENIGTDWDLAYTEKEENSASAYCTAGKKGTNMYIDEIGFIWAEFPKLITYMNKRRFPHYIEAKASGKSAKQVLTNRGIPAIEVEIQGGGDKIARTRLATPYAEAGQIYCRRSILDRLYNDIQQGLLLFPTTHDDLNDAVVQAINRLLAGHQQFVF